MTAAREPLSFSLGPAFGKLRKEKRMQSLQASVLDGIQRAVRDFPGRDALRTEDNSMSYRELSQLADDVADRLRDRTSPGEFVGIEGSRSMGAIVAMLGAMTARRPYVFLDSRDSTSSNAAKVRLLGIQLLATTGQSGLVDLTEVPSHWRQPRGGNPSPGLGQFKEGEIGYAVYTSGSTGQPKCVLVRAAPLGPVIEDHVARLRVGPESRTLQFARLTFDGCITEILWTLTAGAALVVLDEQHLAPGSVLQETLERHGITHLKTTPFALSVTEPTAAMRLEHVINGGGACRPSVVRKWSAAAAVHNAYGLTETTVCNFLSGALDPAETRERVPLGDPIGDCRYRIRAEDRQAGTEALQDPARGELVITGGSVAAGYLTERGLRRFGAAGEESFYPTGDIVELRDGRLYFENRLDRQVKIRGYRVDLGEIESAVCRVDSVTDAAVVPEAYDGGDASDLEALVCYYLGDAAPRSVRDSLERDLDPYKIPSVLERADAFPLTPNGKVDLDALRSNRRARGVKGGEGDRGSKLLSTVRALTGVADAGLEDNFFEVGGDSASAVVLVDRLRELGWADAGVRDVLRAENLDVLVGRLAEQGVR